jgi:hypothetical protein
MRASQEVRHIGQMRVHWLRSGRIVGNTEVSRRYFRVAGNTSKTLNSSELSECIGDLASTGLPLQSTQEFAESVTRRLPREESPP